nr:hypothetical protein [Tanacetum cinerariifolium]
IASLDFPQIREEFRTSSGPSDSGGNPPPVTIHTCLKRFNKQKPRSFEKATAPVDAENWISHMEKIFDVMGCENAFKTRLVVYKFEGNAVAWWKAYKQAKGCDVWLITVTWAVFKELFFLQFFPRAEQERLKREYHSIRQTSTLNHLMCIPFTDVAQVADAARNYEILHERDDDDAERPDKRRVVIGISRPLNRVVTGTMVIIMTVMDQTGEVVVTTTPAATTTTLATTTGISSRGPSKGYSYPVCTTCGRRHPGECRRAAGTCFKCGQTGHLQKDCKKNIAASTSGQADKKPGASGRVFAITEDHATKTS